MIVQKLIETRPSVISRLRGKRIEVSSRDKVALIKKAKEIEDLFYMMNYKIILEEIDISKDQESIRKKSS